MKYLLLLACMGMCFLGTACQTQAKKCPFCECAEGCNCGCDKTGHCTCKKAPVNPT